jgi:hypothetical protein
MQVITNEKWLLAVAGGANSTQQNGNTGIAHPFIHTLPGELSNVSGGPAVSQPQ